MHSKASHLEVHMDHYFVKEDIRRRFALRYLNFIFLIGKKNCIKRKLLHSNNEVGKENICKRQKSKQEIMYKRKGNLRTAGLIP